MKNLCYVLSMLAGFAGLIGAITALFLDYVIEYQGRLPALAYDMTYMSAVMAFCFFIIPSAYEGLRGKPRFNEVLVPIENEEVNN